MFQFHSSIRINGRLLLLMEHGDGYAQVTVANGRGSVTVDGQQAKEALARALTLPQFSSRDRHAQQCDAA